MSCFSPFSHYSFFCFSDTHLLTLVPLIVHRVDDIKLTSFEGLGIIPIDILEGGSKKIVQYILDLFSSPDADPLYRSKLMVVGFENVGKTAILDCLFPAEDWLLTQGVMKKTRYWCKLQGSVFSKFGNPDDLTPHKDRETFIENRQWEVATLTPKTLAIKVTRKGVTDFQSKRVSLRNLLDFTREKDEERDQEREKEQAQTKVIELHFPDKDTHNYWFARFKKVCMNEATHGIEIQSLTIDNSVTREFFKTTVKEADSQEKLKHRKMKLSVWDFAGQHEYYNNHHHFISTRTVFLVLWKMSEGDEKGMKGLEFWLRSLAAHLVGTSPALSSGVYFSVFVVGTFLDHPLVNKEERGTRATKVDQLAKECGLQEVPIQYFEVSCGESLENINILQEAISKTVLSHTYMGERVPMKYLSISDYLVKARENLEHRARESAPSEGDLVDRSNSFASQSSSSLVDLFSASSLVPVMNIQELVEQFGDRSLVQRALNLLSLWGECIYYDSPPDLANLVILDPKFLAKGILADLFTSDETSKGVKKGGIVQHSHLVLLWSKFRAKTVSQEAFAGLCKTFLTLLEKMDVCFIFEEDKQTKEFMDQRTVIPALLPDIPLSALTGAKFGTHWPKDPPHNRPIQIERILRFSVIPSELVSRLLVHLHEHIQENLVTKNEILILVKEMENSQAWIRVDQQRNRFFVTIRGGEVKECIKLLEYIVQQVEIVAQKYKAVTWDEAIRSPHFSGVEIPVSQITTDAAKPLDKRALECPDTRFPIRAEKLLFRAGLIDKVPPIKGDFFCFLLFVCLFFLFFYYFFF